MKKSKFLALGLIALLMAVGLVLAGCKEPGCSRDGKCEYYPAVFSGPNPSSGVDNVCSDSDCDVYEAKSRTSSSSDCSCS